MRENEKVILEAEFNPKVKTYWMLTGVIILLSTFVGIVLIPIWVVVAWPILTRYVERMRCAVTEKSVLLNKGILVRHEKTVPLDKITDVGLVQGPIMRSFDLHKISFETAGQTAGMNATLSVTGVINGKNFRNQVLKLRDQLTYGSSSTKDSPAAGPNQPLDGEVLHQILAVLERIEEKLEK